MLRAKRQREISQQRLLSVCFWIALWDFMGPENLNLQLKSLLLTFLVVRNIKLYK